MPIRFPPNSKIVWKKTDFGLIWATIEHFEVGRVRETVIAGRWTSVVLSPVDGLREMHCYAGSEERARYYVEKFWQYRNPDIQAIRRARRAFFQSDAPLPRKPKGLEDRS